MGACRTAWQIRGRSSLGQQNGKNYLGDAGSWGGIQSDNGLENLLELPIKEKFSA